MATSPPSKRMKLDFLLNPESSQSETLRSCDTASHSQQPSYVMPTRGTSSSRVPAHNRIAKDGANFCVRSGPKGDVNFPPFQDFDNATLAHVRKFSVHPLSDIQNFCRHIPYNSGKKDFQVKTGREGFEVFQYTFTFPPGQDTYTVMWDYNIGLVRITPFFRCCKYPKTTPGKMLCLNPGLKELSHSITGGAIVAQGYWLSYNAARAVCATFCYYISGALIPIFGPDFPASCTPPGSEGYGYMKIDPEIVRAAAREAEIFRLRYGTAETSAAPQSTEITVKSATRTLCPRRQYEEPTRKFTPWNQQLRPSIESQPQKTPGATPARTPLPRHPMSAAAFPSPETPTVRTPEFPSHRPPRSHTHSHESSRYTDSRSRRAPNSARPIDDKWPAYQCQLGQGPSYQPGALASFHFASQKRGSSELSDGDDADATGRDRGRYVRRSNIRPLSRPQVCLSPPNSSYPSSICSEAGRPLSRDVSTRSSPTITTTNPSRSLMLSRASSPEKPAINPQAASQVAAMVLLEMSSSATNTTHSDPDQKSSERSRANSL